MAIDEIMDHAGEDIASIDGLMQDDAFVGRHIGPSDTDVQQLSLIHI